MINSRKQNGSTSVVIVVIAVAVILGILGYAAWSNFLAPKNDTVNTNEAASTEDATQTKTEYKTVKINNHNFRYPENENNEKVIIIQDESTPALQISYMPIRSYYANKEVSNDCKNYIAGLVNASSENELIESLILERQFGKESLEEALADGVAIRVAEKDIYLTGPFKHNELCSDIYASTDPELKTVLSETKDIRSVWLRSLELVE